MAEFVSVFPIFDLPWIETLIIIFSVFCFLLTRKVRNELSSEQTRLNPHFCTNDKQSLSVINNYNTSQDQHNEDSGQLNKTQSAKKQNTNSTTCGQNGTTNQRLQQNGQNKALTLKDALNVAENSHSLPYTKQVEGWDDETENIETPSGISTSQLQQQHLNEGKSVEQNTGASSDLPKSLHSRMPNKRFTVAYTTDKAHNTELNANVLNENQTTKTTFDGQNAASSNDAQILLVSGHEGNEYSVKRAQTKSIFDVENLKSKELMQNEDSTFDMQIKDTLLAEQCVHLEQSVAHAQKAEVSSDALFPHLNQYQKQRSHDAQNEETNMQSHQSKQENHNYCEQIKDANALTHTFNDTQYPQSNHLFPQNTESLVYVRRNGTSTDVLNWHLHKRHSDEEPADRTQNVDNLVGEKKAQLQQSDQSHTFNQNKKGSPTSLQKRLIGEQRNVSYTSENKALDALKIKAQQLGLVIFSVPGNTMLGAIEDQLRVLNPKGHYELRKANLWHEDQENGSDRNGWPHNSELLQRISNLYNRDIEIVHGDMLGSMIIRPRDRARQTLYIGYVSQGCYYSLRPVDVNPTTQNGTACSADGFDFAPQTEIVENNEASATGTAAAIGQKYNILVGDDCTQFVIQMPAKDKEEEDYTEITNVVIGEGNTQNVVVTFRTAKSIVEFLQKNYTKETCEYTQTFDTAISIIIVRVNE